MKLKINSLILILAIAFLSSCTNQQKAEKAEINEENVVQHTYMTTLHCEACVNTIQTKMPDNDGIANAVADKETKKVVVSFDPAITDDAQIIEAFQDLGYEAEVIEDVEPDVLPEPDTAELDSVSAE